MASQIPTTQVKPHLPPVALQALLVEDQVKDVLLAETLEVLAGFGHGDNAGEVSLGPVRFVSPVATQAHGDTLEKAAGMVLDGGGPNSLDKASESRHHSPQHRL